MDVIFIKADDFNNLTKDQITNKLVRIIENNDPIRTSSLNKSTFTFDELAKHNTQSINKSYDYNKTGVNNYRKLYKYYSLDGGISALLEGTLLFNYPSIFNDLFECRFTSDNSDVINKNGQHVVLPYNLSDSFMILCLTTSPDNFLMWTFYANSFDGLVVEYEVPDKIPNSFIVDVNYYSESQYDSLLDVYKNYFANLTSKQNREDAINLIKLMAGNKHKVWEYEHETRLVKFVDDDIFNCVKNHGIVSQDLHKDINESLRLFKCSDLWIVISKIYIGYRFLEKYEKEFQEFLLEIHKGHLIDLNLLKYKHVKLLKYIMEKYGRNNINLCYPLQRDSSVVSEHISQHIGELSDYLKSKII